MFCSFARQSELSSGIVCFLSSDFYCEETIFFVFFHATLEQSRDRKPTESRAPMEAWKCDFSYKLAFCLPRFFRRSWQVLLCLARDNLRCSCAWSAWSIFFLKKFLSNCSKTILLTVSVRLSLQEMFCFIAAFDCVTHFKTWRCYKKRKTLQLDQIKLNLF